MLLYRPVGLNELRLIADSGYRAFPPRLPDQPIFYPVLSIEYARQIACDWNTKSEPYFGFVTQFEVDESVRSQYAVQTAGAREHQELWVPADELGQFNARILGCIRVLEAYAGDQVSEQIAPASNLPVSWDQAVPYSPKTPAELIATYSPSDSKRIRFDWNGRHADEFEDRNRQFRLEVLQLAMADLKGPPALLLRDLFTALTEFSREAWCIDPRVRELGRELLRRDPERFVFDYVRGLWRSFDSYVGAHVADADPDILQRCLTAIRDALRQPQTEDETRLLRKSEEMFHAWLSPNKSAS